MIRSLLVVGMTLSAFAMADEMNSVSSITRRGKALPQTMVIKIDKKNPNKIEVAHVREELKAGDKQEKLAFSKMGLGDEVSVAVATEDLDPMQTAVTPAARGGFARGGYGGGFRGGYVGRPGIGRPGYGGIGRPGYPYARGYVRGAARGAYWGARYGYGAGYGTGYYNAAGYYNGGGYYGDGYYDQSYYGGGYSDPYYYDSTYGGESAYVAGYSPIYTPYVYSGCGSYCGGAWAQPFYNYYGYYYPYRPYYSWASASSYYVYCRPWSWWG